MASRRHVQVAESIAHLAGAFLARELHAPAGGALVTVTHSEISPDLKKAVVFLSVLPRTREKEALTFAKRARSDFRAYIVAHSALHPVPTVDFELDIGEKNRQRVDDLTRK